MALVLELALLAKGNMGAAWRESWNRCAMAPSAHTVPAAPHAWGTGGSACKGFSNLRQTVFLVHFRTVSCVHGVYSWDVGYGVLGVTHVKVPRTLRRTFFLVSSFFFLLHSRLYLQSLTCTGFIGLATGV